MGEVFGDLLRELRLAAGVTQTRLAELSGVSVQAISLLERGQRTQPRVRTVSLLAEALRLSEADAARLQASVVRPGVMRVPLPTLASDDVPRSLPPVVGDFPGRSDQVELITGLLTSTEMQRPGSAVVVSAIEGMGGIGKTTLAVRVAHLVAEEFPDGQLYLNLQGFGPGEPMAATEALGRLLGMLGTSATGDEAQASARYRTMLADKRMLVVLDNARDAEQVVPLLPGTAGSAAIVTSRRSLSTLPGAQHVQLDELTEDEGIALLSAIIGAGRARAESAAVTDVVRRCARLPLAIRMAGARLAARPTWPVSVLADQLADERRRLDELEVLDAGVRASFLASVRGLQQSPDPVDRAAATAFPLLGILDTPDLSIDIAASLLDMPSPDAGHALERLVDSHLLDTPTPGRYRLHDLLRAYAREFVPTRLTMGDRDAAIVRVLRRYNSIIWRAYSASSPTHVRMRYMDEVWIDADVNDLDPARTLSWAIDERANIVALLRQAAEAGGVPPALITQVAIASLFQLNTGGHWPLLTETGRISQRVAVESGDRTAEAFALHDQSAAATQLQRYPEAIAQMTGAVEIFRATGDPAGEAMALCNLSYIFIQGDRLDEGVETAHRALDLCGDAGLDHLEATTCLALGMLYGRLGKRDAEVEYYRRSLATYAKIGYDRGRARAQYNLAVAHLRAGRPDEAREAFHHAVELCDPLDMLDTASEARTELAEIYAATDDLGRAFDFAEEAVSIAVSCGSEFAEARARQALGFVLDGLSRTGEAVRQWTAALELYERLGAPLADEMRALLAQRGQHDR